VIVPLTIGWQIWVFVLGGNIAIPQNAIYLCYSCSSPINSIINFWLLISISCYSYPQISISFESLPTSKLKCIYVRALPSKMVKNNNFLTRFILTWNLRACAPVRVCTCKFEKWLYFLSIWNTSVPRLQNVGCE